MDSVITWDSFKHGARVKLSDYVHSEMNDGHLPLWKYMGFPAFVDLLNRSTLFFANPSLLMDVLEGTYPQGNYDKAKVEERKRSESYQFLSLPNRERLYRQAAAISCWTTWERENTGMWEIYSDVSTGIAIKTSLSSLANSFPSQIQKSIRAGCVTYMNYEESTINEGNQARPYFFKTPAYAHEREFRLYYSRLHLSNQIPEGVNYIREGVTLSVDLKILIEKIVCPPKADIWFIELVKLLVDNLGLECPVENSEVFRSDWKK
ncbi:MAG: DUF2971 domain-containing protein [Fimbriimonadaceae bacterium]|nr:MAG: DUF2971 domain-containing protein [Fimbriimonadaceae bacterium]